VTEAQTKSQTRSRSKPQGKDQTRSQPRSQGARQPANQLDVDGVLVGRKVVIAVVVGNEVARVVGTIIAMGRYWVVVNIESSEIPTIQGTVYLNKGSVIAYMPVDSETPGSNHDSKTKH